MRVVILADDSLAAEAIRRSMRHAPACRVLGYINVREPWEDALHDAGADLVLIDETDDADVLAQRITSARAATPGSKLVLLTQCMQAEWLSAAAAAGVDAAVCKSAEPTSIGMLVREIAAGHVFHAFLSTTAPGVEVPVAAASLTARELEILRLVAGGRSNGQIAAELWVTQQTVKFHLSNTYRKLGVANRTEASHFAHVHGLLRASPAVTEIPKAA